MTNYGDVTCDSCNNTFKVNLADIENKQFNECPFCHKKLTDKEKTVLHKEFQKKIGSIIDKSSIKEEKIDVKLKFDM